MLNTKTRKRHQAIWTGISIVAIVGMLIFLVIPLLTTL